MRVWLVSSVSSMIPKETSSSTKCVGNEGLVPSGAGSGTNDLVCDQNPAAPEDTVVTLSDISVWVLPVLV